MGYKIGDMVTWTSQSHSYYTTKVGKVVAIIPAGINPEHWFFHLKSSRSRWGRGGARDHKSYVVDVDGVKYHPIVKHLQSYIPVKDFKGYTQIVPLNYKEGK